MSLEERNSKIRERMLNLTEIKLCALPTDSFWLRPKRMKFLQDGKEKNWDLMRSHDSVSMVVFNITRKKLIFVRQFRPAAYYACLPENIDVIDLKKYPPTLGLTLELCAGIVDKNKSLAEIAQDELKEECGYEAPLSAFKKIITYRYNLANILIFSVDQNNEHKFKNFIRSISFTTSKQTLFYVEVTDEMNTQPGKKYFF